MNDTTIATVRTGWNTTIFAAFAALVYKLFGWEVKVEDLLPYLPVILPVAAAFYRLSRLISEKLPWIGYVLFGVNRPPSFASATPVNEPTPKDSGQVPANLLWTVVGVLLVIVLLTWLVRN